MEEKIKAHMSRAFADESKGAARHSAFALKANQEGRGGVAKMFRAVEFGKSIHARRFLLLMRGKVGETEENLRQAMESEMDAIANQYPSSVREAKNAPKAVKKAFKQTLKTNQEYVRLYDEALGGKATEGGPDYYVCRICGHIHVDSVPDKCPICQAVPSRFKKIE